jgi:hypothetical protein
MHIFLKHQHLDKQNLIFYYKSEALKATTSHKITLQPLYFSQTTSEELQTQLGHLYPLLGEDVFWMPPKLVGEDVSDADAVVLPVIIGQAYRQVEDLKALKVPIMAMTSVFGTVAMWDWEIITFMQSEGVKIYAPYTLELAKTFCRTLAVKKQMPFSKFVVYQDNPGDGMQAEIFKRFYWWEDQCTQLIKEKFGISIEQRSFKALGERAKTLPDTAAQAVIEAWQMRGIDLSPRPYLSAIKMYIALKEDLEADPSIVAAGINCLNESFHSDTTPCLAWSMLYEEKGIIWGCEADTLSMLTMYLVNKCTDASVIMTNLYPFLSGPTALKHEKIDQFPEVTDPENCVLVGHCGFQGVIPRCMTLEWSVQPKVLGIVDENAHAIDARLPIGPVTLAKLHPKMGDMQVIQAHLEDYKQYPGSDCRNGAIIRVQDGYQMIKSLYSHHYCVIPGRKNEEIEMMNQLLEVNTLFL